MNIFLLIISFSFYFVSNVIVATTRYILNAEANKIDKYMGTIFYIFSIFFTIKFLSLIFIGFYLNDITLTVILVIFDSKIIPNNSKLIKISSKWLIKFINKSFRTESKDSRV